jgi:hypothetical protein
MHEFQSTHGGFDGPYGKKVKTIWTQEEEGRTRKGQESGNAYGEESQARRKAQEQRAEDDGAQEDRAQSGAEEGGIRQPGHADTVIIIDGTAAGRAHGAETADAHAEPGTAAGSATAAASGHAVSRLVEPIDAVIGTEAVRGFVFDAAEASWQQLGRQRLRRRVELLADLHLPSPSGERGAHSRNGTAHYGRWQ